MVQRKPTPEEQLLKLIEGSGIDQAKNPSDPASADSSTGKGKKSKTS